MNVICWRHILFDLLLLIPLIDFRISVTKTRERTSAKCGILCRHLLNILAIHYIRAIPTQYILRRWTKNIKKYKIMRGGGLKDTKSSVDRSKILRFNELRELSKIVCQRGSENDETYSKAIAGLKKIIEEFNAPGSTTLESELSSVNAQRLSILGQVLHDNVNPCNKSGLLDPLPVSTIGGSSGNRLLSGLETPMLKSRKCSMCQKTGHNRRSCLLFKEGSTMTAPTGIDSTGQHLHTNEDNDDKPMLSFNVMESAPSFHP